MTAESVKPTIRVLYSCQLCGLVDAVVPVPARQAETDVRDWMSTVCIIAVGADHAAKSPNCHPETLSAVKIPISGADYIGGPTVQ